MSTTPALTPSASKAESMLSKEQMTDLIVTAKVSKKLTWTSIAQQMGVDEVWLASACLGMNSMKGESAEKLCAILDLPPEVQAALEMFPYKKWSFAVPQDPLGRARQGRHPGPHHGGRTRGQPGLAVHQRLHARDLPRRPRRRRPDPA